MSRSTKKRSTEELLIERIQRIWRRRHHKSVVLGIGDDCAVTRLNETHDLLTTTDQVIEKQHFVRAKQPMDALGHKALVRSLSDIAAMGGEPLHVVLTLGLPEWSTGTELDDFVGGMRSAADECDLDNLSLIGGDVARAEVYTAGVTVTGTVPRGRALQRSGARPGESVYVSGSLGGSRIGLNQILGESEIDIADPAVERHLRPTPRLALGAYLREIGATAAIDLSDGLATDARRIAKASGVALEIDADQIPLFDGASMEDALVSGEEYELLFTAMKEIDIPPEYQGIAVTAIGTIQHGKGVFLKLHGIEKPLQAEGFDHFYS